MAFDILGFYNKHKDYYGDAPLDKVAKDVYTRAGYDKEYPDFDTWAKQEGVDQHVQEDLKRRNPQKEGSASLLRRAVADPLSSLAKGFIIGVPETIVGLADIPTLGHAGKAVDAGIKALGGVGFKKAGEHWDESLLSPEALEAKKKVEEAKGFIPTVQTSLENPSSIVSSIMESIPSMIGGAALGRTALAGVGKAVLGKEALEMATKGLSKDAAKELFEKNTKRAILAGAVGEGLVSAGQNTEQVRQLIEDGLLSPAQVAVMVGSGAATGIISKMSGGLSKRLGITDVDTLLQGVDTGAKQSGVLAILKGVIGSAISEGALEELPQSAQEQMAQNVALGKPPMEGVAEAGAMGLLAGAGMGIGGAGLGVLRRRGSEKTDDTEGLIRKLQIGAVATQAIDTGLKTGQLDGDPFTPENALEIIREGQNSGIYDNDSIERFKDRYPQLRDGLNGVITESLIKKIDAEASPEPRPDSISQTMADMERLKKITPVTNTEEDVPEYTIPDEEVPDGTLQTETAIADLATKDAKREEFYDKAMAAGVPEERIQQLKDNQAEIEGNISAPTETVFEQGVGKVGKASGYAVTKEGLEIQRQQDLADHDAHAEKVIAETPDATPDQIQSLKALVEKQKAETNALYDAKIAGLSTEKEAPPADLAAQGSTEGKESAAGEVKEPWQMTQDEFVASELSALSEHAPQSTCDIRKKEYIQKYKKTIIPLAISQGKPVPPHVLAAFQGETTTPPTDKKDIKMAGTAFSDMVKEAQRWKGAAYKVDASLGDDKKARLAHSHITTKADLDRYLMKKFGIDEVTARNISNELTAKDLKPDMTASVEDFAGEPWAKGGQKQAPKDTLFNKEPPGGWTEKDKVPPPQPKKDMKREMAITKYRAHVLEHSPNTGNELVEKIVGLIDARDGIGLRDWMNGINPKINKLFFDLTGLPARTQKEADASLRSLNPEKWDVWQKEKTEKQEKQAAETAERYKKQDLDAILEKQVRHDGKVITLRELYDDAIKKGYTEINEKKMGVGMLYRLTNPQTGAFFKIKKKAEAEYVKARIEEIKKEAPAAKPKEEAPAPKAKPAARSIVDKSQFSPQAVMVSRFLTDEMQTVEEIAAKAEILPKQAKMGLEELTKLGVARWQIGSNKYDRGSVTIDYGREEATADTVAFGSENKIFTEDKANKAREILRKKLGGINMGVPLDPEIIQAGIDLAGYYIEGGARSFSAYAGKMIGDLGDSVRSYLKSFYMAVRNYPGFDKTGMDNEAALDEIDEKAIDITLTNPAESVNITTKGGQNEHPTDGSTSAGTLESDKSGNLSADGRGQGTRRGKRSSSQADNEGNQDLDAGGLDGSGSVAGKSSPIHLQDSGTDGEVVSTEPSAVEEPASEPRTIQLSGINPGNYRITEDDDIGSGTRGQKIDRNIAAIRLIKKLDQEHRYPTKEEQSVLAKYVGWGGIKNVFDETSNKPQDQRAYADLKELLTKEEFFEARQSVLNAHYTSPQVIRSIYKIMSHFGFTGGNILEPTYGAGNFIGLMPEDMAASSKWYGSELDPITAKIGQYLYPDSQLIHSGFQNAEFPYGKFDAEVGNPPFGDVRISDTRKERAEINRMKIHNYVISKSGLHLRPGGISANVITTRFLDTADPEARDFLSKNFKFLGAIRLPNDAFAKNAGTEVTTDLVFFQRLMPGEKPDMSADWLTTGATMTNKDGEEITLNKYFAKNPDLMLGEPSMKGTMYGGAWKEGGKGEFTLNKHEGVDIEEAIDKVIREQFFDLKDVARSNNDTLDAAALSLIPNKEDVAVGGFFMDKDNIFMREDNDEYGNPTYTRLTPKTKWTEKQLLGETRYLRIKGMLELRAKAYELVNAERFDLGNIEPLRKQLNFLYDNFVKNYGFISESSNFSLMSDDIKIEFGLEIDFKKEITKAKAKSLGVKPSPASAEKATLLKERMFYPEKEILYAKDAADGYNISLFQKGKLDIDYIATLTGTARESVIADLSKDGLIYQDPVTKEWIQEDEYLSGNVKEKYKKVEGKEGFEKNAKDLKKVFPADVPTEEIFANPGATWIPEKVYEQFGHFIGVENPSVSIYRNNGQFSMRSSGQKQNDINVAWLNSYYSISDIFNAVANNKVLIAWDGTGDDRTQNKEQTAELATIVQGVRSTFSDWIFADDARASELTKIYNATQNTHAKRKNDGTHLHTVGASPAVILRNTQRDAAWRIIQSKRVLLDHCVGAGKTYTIITGVQERVRMGLTRKAMIAVPNHLVGQWAADYMRLYPGARILAATKKDFSKPNRRRLFARIATGKYDAIIVGHSSFGFIPLETESLTNLMMEEIAQLEAAHAQADADGNKRLVKTLANRIAKKREKINELLGRPRDNVTTFEAMGIDHLVVDESHEFKNLEYSSAMQNITGMGNPMGSKRAFDMYAKIRWLTAQKDYALNFATGTPISNSLVEMYALLRYMNRDALYARGIDAFDSWANTYASIEPRIEYTASQKLKQRTVMATFNNLPELLQLYEEFADIVTMPDLKRIYAEQIRERNARTGGNESEDFPVPKVKDGGRTLDVADPSQEQVEYVDYLVARAERMEELGRQNDPKVDNHLWIMSDARKMALDIRLVDPTAKESPNNKINRATKKIKEIYDRTEKDKGAQLVFCDLSTPSGSAQKNAAVFIREALKKAHLETDARTKAILDSLSTYQEKWGYIRNRLEAEIEAISDHSQAETEQYMKRREEIEDYLEKVTDDVTSDLTTADTGFSVYDEMKSKLIMMGIPEGEVKFIHDANTEQQKEDLFAMVNSGQVRVLLGSSQKMGAGMNVQERLVALHHMDAPWRPSDVEQREGRLVRQGNKLYSINPDGFKVEIKAYSTSNTFDAVMWQILARKGGMLDDFRSGRRTVEEVSMDGANYSEFMAETTGNPAFKEKFKLEGDIKSLRAIKNRTTTRLRSSQQSIDYNKDARIKSQAEIEKRDKIINDLKGQSTFTFEGKQYKDNAKDLVAKEASEIAEYNARVNKEYNETIDAAINKAFEDKYKNTGWYGAWIKPEFPWGAQEGSQEKADYKEARAAYDLFMDNEERQERISEAVKGIKKPTNKHFHSTKLAKSDKTGVIAAALKMVDEINALDDGESFTYQLGNTEIEIKKADGGLSNHVKVEDRTRLWDYVVTADGMFLDRLERVSDFDERNIWNLLNVEAVNNRMAGHRRDAASYVERMDKSDEVSKHTLESLKFKDDEKLQRMESRYQEVLVEVQDAEAEISARRAATGNKYIRDDRPRFPAGVWEPTRNGAQNQTSEQVEIPDEVIDEDIETLKKKLKQLHKETDADLIDEKIAAARKLKHLDAEEKELNSISTNYAINLAEMARIKALLSQSGEGATINEAQEDMDAAYEQWNEYHEGEAYPHEIKLAQQVVNSISSGQGRLFKGTLYSGLDVTQTLNVLRGLKSNLKAAMPHIEAIGRKLWNEGNQTREKWFAGMKRFLGDLWDSFKNIARLAWNKIREERGSISFEKKEGQKKAPQKQAPPTDDITLQYPRANLPNPTRHPEVGGQTNFQRQEKHSIRKQQDPPTSRDPKVLNLYLKDETDALIQTMMNKLHPPHMTWLETILKSPEWFGHPQIQNIVKLFMRDRNEIYHETFNDLNMADDIDAPESTVTEAAKALKNKGLSMADRLAGKVSPEYQRLQEIIDEGDTSWKRNISIPLDRQIEEFEKHIRQQGATDDTIRVWKLYRQSYDKALDLQTAQLRQMIDEITEEANFRGEKPDLNELRQTLKGALAQMEEWRGFYAPRLREQGNWKVQAYKEHGPMKENREWYREHRGSELSARRLANKMQREGWKIFSVGQVEKLPETIYQDINATATAKLIDAALEKLSKKSALSNELTLKFNEEVLREVSNAIKARGFRSTMIRRGEKVVRGFIEDPIQRHLLYTNNLSGGIAKARVARMAMAEMLGEKFEGKQIGGIDPVADPKAFQVAQNYIEEQLRNVEPIDRMIGLAKSIATFKFLGFNLRSLAVNTTAIVTTAPAAIHQYALGGRGSLMGIIKELAISGKDYASLMAGKKLANADEQAFLDEVQKKGWDDAQYTREALGEMSKTHSRIWSSMMDGSMYLFGKSEKWNRGTTMLAAYRLARKQGMGHGGAAEVAKEASDKAHGVYGKSTMPMWAQGTNPAAKIGQMFYAYQKFGHNYLQMLYDMGLKKHNIKAAMFAFLSPLVLAGGAALPFKDAIFSVARVILSALFGEDRDPEKWVWDEIRKHLGADAEKIGRHGLTGALGVDISGSLSAGVGIPKNFIDLTGAIGGVVMEIKEAKESIGNKQYGKAAEHLLPTGFANPIRAIREAEQGVTTRNNRRIWDEQGRPYRPSPMATVARTFGFRSTDQAVLSERTWEGHRQQADFADKRNAIYERYRAWTLGKRDREEYKEIVKEVRDYNKKIRELRIPGVSPITSQSLQNQTRHMAVPSKNERALLRNQ